MCRYRGGEGIKSSCSKNTKYQKEIKDEGESREKKKGLGEIRLVF